MRALAGFAASWLLLAASVHAAEPRTVRVDGVVAAAEPGGPPPRDAAFRAALIEAVLEVARESLPQSQLERESESIRHALAERAEAFVLTYRIDQPLERRVSPLDPSVHEWVLGLVATVDASLVREHLRTQGLLRGGGDKPSVVLRLRPPPGLSRLESMGSLVALEQYLKGRLSGQDLVVIEPALRASDLAAPRSALELARAVGADVGIQLDVTWAEQGSTAGVLGGTAAVRARAQRAADGTEIALSRFEAAGYHAVREEALSRALEGVRAQLADNLILQLGRNWAALSERGGPLEVELQAVTRLGQVDAVQRALANTLGASRAEIIELAPGRVQLRVEARLSPGALQDRLAAQPFEGFALEPVEVGLGRVALRVIPALAPGSGEREPTRQN